MTGVDSQTQGQDAAKAASEIDFVALRPGQMVGRYEITAILGQGGFGITYRARDAQLNRDVAIKEYLPTALAVRQDGITVLPRSTKMADDFTWGRQRFVDEGRTLASLEHAPAIVQVFDFLEANGTAYIVMKLVPGETLEGRIKKGTLSPAEVERILWPLLDGLERVHNAGFLHRDIKPANILLDTQGNPTLIDFGASRAAMAGRTSAMTAIFTPGYAAAEQMTSAKQGPWTDIYGVSATIYHAITGAPPPSAFDRMLDDDYVPLAQAAPAGFSPGLLVGIDAGLAVRATDRPQTIAGWRQILGQVTALDAQATVALARTPDPNATQVVRRPTITPATAAATVAPPEPAPASAPTSARKGRAGLWIGVAAALLLLGGGGYWYMNDKAAKEQAAAAARVEADKEQAARDKAAKQQEEKMQAELQKLRDQEAARAKAEEEKRIEDEARKKIEAEIAEKQKAEEAQKAQQAADLAEKQKADEQARKDAETGEAKLGLTTIDRQHIQVALTALGFNTNGTDGVFGQHTRDMISDWQKARSYPATGFVTGPQNQALLRDAAPAIAKFDDEAKKKLDEEKTKPPVATRPGPGPFDGSAPQGAGPQIAAAGPPRGPGGDGFWRGNYRCTANKTAGEFSTNFQMAVRGGTGTWVRPGVNEMAWGNHSISIAIHGNIVNVSRVFSPKNKPGITSTATFVAHYDGANTITGEGLEHFGGGRTCEISLTRAP